MRKLPDRIADSKQLDELMSEPSPAVCEFIAALDGDIMILGAGGKIGPTMARMAQRAVKQAGVSKRVIAVDVAPLKDLAAAGIETVQCDMLDLAAVEKLPRAENIIFMAGRKFGSTGSEHLTWAINAIVPYHAARTFTESRIAVFSTGCVYPLASITSGGATEETPPNPIGEYSMSCLGRERMFDYYAHTAGEKVVHIRLNYAVEMRYGVLYDVAAKVWAGEPVDVTMGFANVIWQGDACEQVIRSLGLATSPPTALNVTGPETLSIRQTAQTLGRLMGREVTIIGEEACEAYLNNAARANSLFGNPSVPVGKIIEWLAHWVMQGGESLGKPTHFEVRNGQY